MDPALSRDREHIEETPFGLFIRPRLSHGLASKELF
jgi:hypothetical protein